VPEQMQLTVAGRQLTAAGFEWKEGSGLAVIVVGLCGICALLLFPIIYNPDFSPRDYWKAVIACPLLLGIAVYVRVYWSLFPRSIYFVENGTILAPHGLPNRRLRRGLLPGWLQDEGVPDNWLEHSFWPTKWIEHGLPIDSGEIASLSIEPDHAKDSTPHYRVILTTRKGLVYRLSNYMPREDALHVELELNLAREFMRKPIAMFKKREADELAQKTNKAAEPAPAANAGHF